MIKIDKNTMGYREIYLASKILEIISEGKSSRRLIDYENMVHSGNCELSIGFNQNSDEVYLYDETGYMSHCLIFSEETNMLETFFSCPECGHEGSIDEFTEKFRDPDCEGCKLIWDDYSNL